jgi:serine/threonine-protein kinase
LAQERWAPACARLRASQRLDPQLGTQLHLAHCYERLGKLASAWSSFEAARAFAAQRNAEGAHEAREEVARRRADALVPRLATVMISLAEPEVSGISVELDEVRLDLSRLRAPVPVDPGRHQLVVRVPDGPEWRQSFYVRGEATRAKVSVPVLSSAQPPAAETAPPSAPVAAFERSPEPPRDGPGWMRLAGWITGGVGVVGLALGVGFAIDAQAKADERDKLCPSNSCPSERDAQRITELNKTAGGAAVRANVAFIAGGAALATGVGLVLFAPSGREGPQLSLAAGWDFAAVSLRL